MFKLPLNNEADFEMALIEILSKADEEKNQLKEKINEQLEGFKRNMKALFIKRVEENKGLSSFDEKIYNCYFELIEYYKKAIEIYNKDKGKLTSEKVIKLLEGLDSVLKSRIAQFEEILNIVECKDEKGNFINPILLEKNNIVNSVLNGFEKELSDIDINGFYETIFKSEDFNKAFCDSFSEKANTAYLSNIKKCVLALNDIEKREVIAFYFEMLKEERELLSSVIKVQVDALEKEKQTAEEEKFIQNILFQLREAYQHIKKYVDALIEKFISVDNNNSFEKIEIQKYCSFDELLGDRNNFLLALDGLEGELKEVSIAFFDSYKNGKSDTTLRFKKCYDLCEKIIEAFEKINEFYNKNKDSLINTDKKDILEGIYSTVDIKIDSLKEALSEFKNEGEALAEKLDNKSDSYISDFIAGVIKVYSAANNADFKSKLNAYINDFITQEKNKTEKNANDKADKIILRFKKEQLLFEITTFEEILNYSVSHLRKSEDKNVISYVNEIDNVVEKINKIISDYGIVVISPEPHQLFNGKENEVLMAEKNDEFKKGEIIKVMNSGFKENDIVIIRANVIAAK